MRPAGSLELFFQLLPSITPTLELIPQSPLIPGFRSFAAAASTLCTRKQTQIAEPRVAQIIIDLALDGLRHYIISSSWSVMGMRILCAVYVVESRRGVFFNWERKKKKKKKKK